MAQASAFNSFRSQRRVALWNVKGARGRSQDLKLSSPERDEDFEDLSSFERIAWDYDSSDHSTRGHPLEPLREELIAQKLPDAHTVSQMKDGERIRYAGLVICRQRPGTASGVTFMTLEDETGFVNVVLWKAIFDQFMIIAKTASFLGVTGKLQKTDGVVHVVADKLWIPKVEVKPQRVSSRDFH